MQMPTGNGALVRLRPTYFLSSVFLISSVMLGYVADQRILKVRGCAA
jgi:hypothetical protein